MRSASVLILGATVAAVLAACDPPAVGDAPLISPYAEILAQPDQVTLLGPAHARWFAVLGRTSPFELEVVPHERTSVRSSDEGIVRASGDRLIGGLPGAAIVTLRVGELETSIEVTVLTEPPPFARAVIDVTRGEGDGYGRSRLPEIVLGPPRGQGVYQGSTDTLSLGVGGAITLGLLPLTVYDGPGPDLLVFENPFMIAGTGETFAEPGRVSVAFGSSEWSTFACDGETWPYAGCAGVRPVLAGPGAPEIDPTDVVRAGGDAFDLASAAPVSPALADRVHIADAGTGTVTAEISGFDLDAIALVHVLPADVTALVAPISVLSVHKGEVVPVPRFDAVRADGTRIHAVSVRLSLERGAPCEATPEGVAAIEGELVRAIEHGCLLLSAWAGPFSTRVEIEVVP